MVQFIPFHEIDHNFKLTATCPIHFRIFFFQFFCEQKQQKFSKRVLIGINKQIPQMMMTMITINKCQFFFFGLSGMAAIQQISRLNGRYCLSLMFTKRQNEKVIFLTLTNSSSQIMLRMNLGMICMNNNNNVTPLPSSRLVT